MVRYSIITPAHNEERFISRTIRSMVEQTVRPVQWLIVDDASSDRTAEVVQQYTSEFPFIQLVRHVRSGQRSFGHKVAAFKYGLGQIGESQYDFIGNLDADVSFKPDYFATLLNRFAADPKLGIGGGAIYSDHDGKFISQRVAPDSVAGAVQLFRRECFEQIGGYMPLPYGGIDAAAEIMARTKGWSARTFFDLEVLEHRRTGSAGGRPLYASAREGLKFHSLGYTFPFYCVRCLYRLFSRPVLVGSLAAFSGFLFGMLKGNPIGLPADAARFLRAEQYRKLSRPIYACRSAFER
jgi:biofilm PGA synthesis N-glycosyltransferase PgaC